MNQAISRAISEEMDRDERIIVLGEDVADAEGPFKTSEGLLARFGGSRVRDTPISEMRFGGAAVGAAMTGLVPVVEIMFVEFLGVALDQLVTEAAMMRHLSADQFTVPLVVRASVGSGLGFGWPPGGPVRRASRSLPPRARDRLTSSSSPPSGTRIRWCFLNRARSMALAKRDPVA